MDDNHHQDDYTPLQCDLGKHECKYQPDFVRVRSTYGHVDISFRRTVRVADNKDAHWLPPDLGPNALYRSSDYPAIQKASKTDNGIFFPVHDLEAMTIHFQASAPFAIRVFLGGVNVLDPGGEIRQDNDFNADDCLYVDGERVTYLDGYTVSDLYARQFVVTTPDSKSSYEAQITGKDEDRRVRIEVFPLRLVVFDTTPFKIKYTALSIPIPRELEVSADTTVQELLEMVSQAERFPLKDMRLVLNGQTITRRYGFDNKWRKLGMLDIKANDIINVVFRLRGGGRPDPRMIPGARGGAFVKRCHILTVAPGGLLRVQRDPGGLDRFLWDDRNPLSFQVALLDVKVFQSLTGLKAPSAPMDELHYSQLSSPSFPYFADYRTLRKDLKRSSQGRRIYAAMKEASPEKSSSIGETRDLSERSQPIATVAVDKNDRTGGRRVNVSEFDKIFAKLNLLHASDAPRSAIVDWNSEPTEVDVDPDSLPAVYNTDSEDEADDDDHELGEEHRRYEDPIRKFFLENPRPSIHQALHADPLQRKRKRSKVHSALSNMGRSVKRMLRLDHSRDTQSHSVKTSIEMSSHK